MGIKHTKTNAIAAWTQTDLDAAIAAGLFPPGTTISQIVLSTDWNSDHSFTGGVDGDYLRVGPGGTITSSTPATASWHQGGDAVASQQSFGTTNAFDIPIIRNNIQVGLWRTGGLTMTPALDAASTIIVNAADGTARAQIGTWTGGSTFGAIYLSSNTPNNNNYSLLANTTTTFVNGSATLNLLAANTLKAQITGTGMVVGNAIPFNQFSIIGALGASANFGMFSMGSATTRFDGSTSGFFAGLGNGTYIAVNADNGFNGSLMSLQTNGVAKINVLGDGANVTWRAAGLQIFTSANATGGISFADANVFSNQVRFSSGALITTINSVAAAGGTSMTLQSTVGAATTSGTAIGVALTNSSWGPTSGNTVFIATNSTAIINQTGTATGLYTGFQMDVTETAVANATGNILLDVRVGGVSRLKIIPEGARVATQANGLSLLTNGGSAGGITLNGSPAASNQIILSTGASIFSSNIMLATGGIGLQITANAGNAMTSGTSTGVQIGSMTFSPTSGNANLIASSVLATINQTSTASGNYTGFLVNITESALLGTDNRLLDLKASSVSKFTVQNIEGNTLINGIPLERTLSSTTGINAKTVASTTAYTVPAGKTAIITRAIVRCTAATAITIGPSIGIGTSAGVNDLFANTAITGLTTTTMIFGYDLIGTSIIVPAAGTVVINVGTASTGTSQTVAIEIMGYLI